MSQFSIRVDNLAKRYRIGLRDELHDTFAGALRSFMRRPLHNYRRLRRLSKFDDDGTNVIWALKDVSFEVSEGEVVGIIGANGAGKTTLLRVLSKITEPTSGRALIRGRVSSLLEVGTGFHPELTGRENVYLNGAVLGMTKTEVDRKFDEIVAFSGVEQFIDTPVKRFSSGMVVRLAFAVAAHLEPEVLLVDEVLAVGDVHFQRKCIGKMQDVTSLGRTVLLVSHNMAIIRSLCERAILLDAGRVVMDGHPSKVVGDFLAQPSSESALVDRAHIEEHVEGKIRLDQPSIRLHEVSVRDASGTPRLEFWSNEEITISVTYDCIVTIPAAELLLTVHILDEANTRVVSSQNVDVEDPPDALPVQPGRYTADCVIPPNLFGENRYYVSVHLVHRKIEVLHADRILNFRVKFAGYNQRHHGNFESSLLRPRFDWTVVPVGEPDTSAVERSMSGAGSPSDG